MMKNIYDNDIYQEDIKNGLKKIKLFIEDVENKSILITGATGLIGSFIVEN